MKRVLIFSLVYHPFIGGAEIALREITDRIGDEFSFDMLTLRLDSSLPRHERIGNINVYRIGFSKKNPTDEELVQFPMYLTKVFYTPLAFFKAVSLHKKNHYSALWVMMAYAGFPVVFFRLFYSKIPYLLTLQEGDSIAHMTLRWRIRIVYPFLKSIFAHARAVSAISTYLGEYARFMGFKGRVEIIPNGVDIEEFNIKNQTLKTRSLKEKFNIRAHDKVIITTSRLVEKNAIDDIIMSLTHLPAHIKLLILGTGPLGDELKSQTAMYKLQDRVMFLGHILHKKLPLYYNIADIFVRPSLSEGMGISFIEAMAAGLPTIGTAVGGITDFLKDRETGFVCKVKNPKSIAEQVKFIIDSRNTDMVERIVQNAYIQAEKNHDWDKISSDMKDIFEKLT